jgi:hypothetical protein
MVRLVLEPNGIGDVRMDWTSSSDLVFSVVRDVAVLLLLLYAGLAGVVALLLLLSAPLAGVLLSAALPSSFGPLSLFD